MTDYPNKIFYCKNNNIYFTVVIYNHIIISSLYCIGITNTLTKNII